MLNIIFHLQTNALNATADCQLQCVWADARHGISGGAYVTAEWEFILWKPKKIMRTDSVSI